MRPYASIPPPDGALGRQTVGDNVVYVLEVEVEFYHSLNSLT